MHIIKQKNRLNKIFETDQNVQVHEKRLDFQANIQAAQIHDGHGAQSAGNDQVDGSQQANMHIKIEQENCLSENLETNQNVQVHEECLDF